MIHVAISVFPIESEIESITDRGSNQLQSCWTSEVVPPASKSPFAKPSSQQMWLSLVSREREREREVHIIYICSGREIDRQVYIYIIVYTHIYIYALYIVGLRCHDMYVQEDIAYTLHMYDMYVDIVYILILYIYILSYYIYNICIICIHTLCVCCVLSYRAPVHDFWDVASTTLCCKRRSQNVEELGPLSNWACDWIWEKAACNDMEGKAERGGKN